MQEIKRINDRFWYQTPVSKTDRPIIAAVVGDEKTLMIDAGNSEAHAKLFLYELEKRKLPVPSLVVITHWHWDHIFGLSALEMPSICSLDTSREIQKLLPYSWNDKALEERIKAGVEIEFCAAAIREEFGQERNIKIQVPTISFQGELLLDLGGVTCHIKQVGGDHAADSTLVYIEEEKILFLADCVYANIFAPKPNYTSRNVTKLLDTIEAFDAEFYVLSHEEVKTKQEFAEDIEMLRKAARLTEVHCGDIKKIVEAYEAELGRKLNEDESEILEYFSNGYDYS